MDNETPNINGGEASKPLANTEVNQSSDVKVKTDEQKFSEAIASIRNKGKAQVDKPLTVANTETTKVDESGDKIVVAENKNVAKKDDKQNKPNGVQGKINGLTRKISERDRYIAQLEKENEEFKKGLNKTRDDFANDAEYIMELSQRKANETLLARELEREKNQRLQDEQEMFRAKVAEQVENPEVFHQRLNKYIDYIDPVTEEYVFGSSNGMKMLDIILDYFEKSPDMLKEFVSMPSAKRGAILVGIDNSLSNQSSNNQPVANVTPEVSKAPSSIAPVKGERLPTEAVTDDEKYNQAIRSIRNKYRR